MLALAQALIPLARSFFHSLSRTIHLAEGRYRVSDAALALTSPAALALIILLAALFFRKLIC